MIHWLIEHEGKNTDLARVAVPEIRDVIEPFRAHVAEKLAPLAGEEGDLRVVFVVAPDGTVRIDLRGDAFVVNRARDLLGPEDTVGPRLQ